MIADKQKPSGLLSTEALACYAVRVLALVFPTTFSGPEGAGRFASDGRRKVGKVEPEAEWQPIPLELPLDDPYRRPPAPAGGEQNPDTDGDGGGRRVIIIDLA